MPSPGNNDPAAAPAAAPAAILVPVSGAVSPRVSNAKSATVPSPSVTSLSRVLNRSCSASWASFSATISAPYSSNPSRPDTLPAPSRLEPNNLPAVSIPPDKPRPNAVRSSSSGSTAKPVSPTDSLSAAATFSKSGVPFLSLLAIIHSANRSALLITS